MFNNLYKNLERIDFFTMLNLQSMFILYYFFHQYCVVFSICLIHVFLDLKLPFHLVALNGCKWFYVLKFQCLHVLCLYKNTPDFCMCILYGYSAQLIRSMRLFQGVYPLEFPMYHLELRRVFFFSCFLICVSFMAPCIVLNKSAESRHFCLVPSLKRKAMSLTLNIMLSIGFFFLMMLLIKLRMFPAISIFLSIFIIYQC